jgi:hypothetical protein
VDFLDVARDGLDTRIERHPGMRLPLERKLALAEQAVAALGHRRRVVPLVEIVDQVCDRDRSAQTDAPEGSSK